MMLFPVKSAPEGCAQYVHWRHLGDPMAELNHGEDLKRLAERGGLSPREILANVRQIRLSDAAKVSDADCVVLVNSIGAEWPKENSQKHSLLQRALCWLEAKIFPASAAHGISPLQQTGR